MRVPGAPLAVAFQHATRCRDGRDPASAWTDARASFRRRPRRRVAVRRSAGKKARDRCASAAGAWTAGPEGSILIPVQTPRSSGDRDRSAGARERTKAGRRPLRGVPLRPAGQNRHGTHEWRPAASSVMHACYLLLSADDDAARKRQAGSLVHDLLIVGVPARSDRRHMK